MDAVLFERQGPVAWVTLNRPASKNLLNAESFVLLSDAWAEVRANDEIRVAVLTGAGDEDFCCGGDLKDLIGLFTGARQPETEVEHRLLADPGFSRTCFFQDEPLYKPIVGAFNGRALGGGCELAQITDVRIAAEHAVFGLPEPKSGVVPGAGSMVRLARQISYANAMKLLLTAEPVSAEEAKDMGLISEVVPASKLKERAEEIATTIAGNAPLALAAIKKTVLDTHTQDWPEAFALEAAQSGLVMRSSDAREGPKAFKERRAPHFTGT